MAWADAPPRALARNGPGEGTGFYLIVIYGEIAAAMIACGLLWATLNIDLLLGKRKGK